MLTKRSASKPISKSFRSAAWTLGLLLAIGPQTAFAEDEEMVFAVVGKMAVYRQTGTDNVDLNTNYRIDGRDGAYVFFSTVDGSAGLPHPELSWSQSAAFFGDFPEITYIPDEDDDEIEWELEWNTNDPGAFNSYFPAGSYTISIGEKEANLQLPAVSLPAPVPINVTGNGDWRNGSYVVAEGNGIELSITAPDWGDAKTRLIHFEMWGPGGRIFSESRINDADFLPGLAPPFTADPTVHVAVPPTALPWVPHGVYTVELLYSTVEDVVSADGILGLAIVESSVRLEVIIARQWTYELWRDMVFSREDAADPSRSGPQVDFIGDGIPNLMKFAVNMPPSETVLPALPQIRLENGRLQASFIKHRFADLNYVVEVSDDLVTWHSGGPHTRLEALVEDFVFFDRVIYSDRNPEGSDHRFMRVRVEPVTP